MENLFFVPDTDWGICLEAGKKPKHIQTQEKTRLPIPQAVAPANSMWCQRAKQAGDIPLINRRSPLSWPLQKGLIIWPTSLRLLGSCCYQWQPKQGFILGYANMGRQSTAWGDGPVIFSHLKMQKSILLRLLSDMLKLECSVDSGRQITRLFIQTGEARRIWSNSTILAGDKLRE